MHDADREILKHFRHVRAGTAELAGRVPGDLLANTPGGTNNSIARQFLHIADGVDWWMANVMHDGQPRIAWMLQGHDSIPLAMENSADRLITFFTAGDAETMDEPFTLEHPDGSTATEAGRQRVLYLIGHELHHRGRIVQALRDWEFNDIPFFP